MSDMSLYLQATSIGTQVGRAVGNAQDGLRAGGYSAFVNSITGAPPTVVTHSDGRVSLVQSPAQNKTIGKWAEDSLLDSFLKRKPAGKVSYEIGPAFKPVVVKYAVPVTAVIFAAGIIVGRKFL